MTKTKFQFRNPHPMPPNSEPDSPPELTEFFVLFRQHWREGTGLAAHDRVAKARDGHWTVRTFCDAMGRQGFVKIDAETVQSWKDGERWPQKARKDAILIVFWQHDEAAEARQAMDRAWAAGQAARSRAPARPQREEPSPQDKWIGMARPERTEGLASLHLDVPQQGNEPDAPWYIRARLRFDIAEHERDDGSVLFIALRKAFLAVTGAGYRVVNGSLIGERSPHRHVRPKPDGVDIVGPCPHPDGCLQGDPFEEDHIALIETAEDDREDDAVTVALYAYRRGFAVSLSPSPRQDAGEDVAAAEKDAVLNMLIDKTRRRDALGRLLVARDVMKRKTPE